MVPNGSLITLEEMSDYLISSGLAEFKLSTVGMSCTLMIYFKIGTCTQATDRYLMCAWICNITFAMQLNLSTTHA